jgi:hypothetical protein
LPRKRTNGNQAHREWSANRSFYLELRRSLSNIGAA